MQNFFERSKTVILIYPLLRAFFVQSVGIGNCAQSTDRGEGGLEFLTELFLKIRVTSFPGWRHWLINLGQSSASFQHIMTIFS
jgi:hypothetical protein